MAEEQKYTITGSESNPHEAYERIAAEHNGKWDGEVLQVDIDWLKFEIISFCYFHEMYIASCQLKTDRVFVLNNEPGDDEKHYIVIRIGYTGSFSKKDASRRFNHDGVFIYNSNQVFSMEYPFQVHSEWVIIRFPYDVFKKMVGEEATKLKALFEDDAPWFQYYSLDPELERYVKEMVSFSHKKSRRRMAFLGRTMDILGALIEKMEEDILHIPHTNIHPEDLKTMVLLKDQILSDFSVLPNLQELSLELGMSVSKLNRLFKSVYKLPVIQFFNKHKIEEVHRHIRYTDKSMTEIAIDLGFSHVGHMSRTFKSHFGYAPSQLRSPLQQSAGLG
ncbi:helix-turn-helix domain-containing protein [Sediminitomix flava]|uniref:AraC-like DNA-binding protein n=1 Tax=Sediminitomix flava TaxID=379075 RepID=A0A315ZTK2_SEDFL|nr:helix-turn-helix domain-containing protein [Sediminitomix flava]PWJ38564.1 AraC-like DNA-binding protein [Sediminitomix flava]